MKMLGQLVGWVQVDGAGSSEGVRLAGGVGSSGWSSIK